MDMDKSAAENPGKTFWRDAATYGGVIGVTLLAIMLLDDFTAHKFSWFTEGFKAGFFTVYLYTFARRRSLKYAGIGFTFGQGMSFIMAMMIFTGFITGIENYLAFNFIAPEYYQATLDMLMENNPAMAMLGKDIADDYVHAVNAALRNPLYLIFSGIIGKVIVGGIVGIIVSAMIKRKPVFTANHE